MVNLKVNYLLVTQCLPIETCLNVIKGLYYIMVKTIFITVMLKAWKLNVKYITV